MTNTTDMLQIRQWFHSGWLKASQSTQYAKSRTLIAKIRMWNCYAIPESIQLTKSKTKPQTRIGEDQK